jgi:hypothetical protein
LVLHEDAVILTATVLDLIRLRLGAWVETSPNRGDPEPDAYTISVGLNPEGRFAWCCSGQYWMFDQAAKKIGGGMVNPFPRTASCASAWRHIEPICKDSNPTVGALYFLRHSDVAWHVGIVESCDGGNVLTELSGNTFSDKGGREGNCWARHHGPPEVTHGGVLQGYANLDLAAQAPGVVA